VRGVEELIGVERRGVDGWMLPRDSLSDFLGGLEDEGGPNEKYSKEGSGGKKHTRVYSRME
jgi:hypothetical protein